jgi:hypothetical protein
VPFSSSLKSRVSGLFPLGSPWRTPALYLPSSSAESAKSADSFPDFAFCLHPSAFILLPFLQLAHKRLLKSAGRGAIIHHSCAVESMKDEGRVRASAKSVKSAD